MNPWQLYDTLIDGIPQDIFVTGCNCGYNWTHVSTSEGGMGLSMTVPVLSLPFTFPAQARLVGKSLRHAAALAKSWNFIEAALGVAAINSYYNHPTRALSCGLPHPGAASAMKDAFDLYQPEIEGRKVAVVGHFPLLEERFGTLCDMTILERNPLPGDYPDSACEYLLGEQDFVFITGCTLVNKTMPRLLELAKNAEVVIVGPSTPLCGTMFDYGAYGLSGMIVHDSRLCAETLQEGNTMALFDVGEMVDLLARQSDAAK